LSVYLTANLIGGGISMVAEGYEPTPLGTIEGFVTDAATGTPIDQAKVYRDGLDIRYTNASGYYKIAELEPGYWYIKVTKEGYQDQERKVDLPRGVKVRADFMLESLCQPTTVFITLTLSTTVTYVSTSFSTITTSTTSTYTAIISTTQTTSITATSTSLTFVTFTSYTMTTQTVTGTVSIPGRCFIASAAYGSELTPEVQFLRKFRDEIVLSTSVGSNFMSIFHPFYYSFSPTVAEFMSKHPTSQVIGRIALYPLMGILHFAAQTCSLFSFNREIGVVAAGFTASALIGIVYNSPWVTVLLAGFRKFRKTPLEVVRLKTLAASMAIGLALILFGETFSSPPLVMVSTTLFVLTTMIYSTLATSKLLLRFLQK